MVSGLIDIHTGCVWRGRKEGLGVEEGNEKGNEEKVKGERRGQGRGMEGRVRGERRGQGRAVEGRKGVWKSPCLILAVHVKAMDQSDLCP